MAGVQRQRSKQNNASCLVKIPRGCISITQAATISTIVHSEHGTITFKRLAVGCQLCNRKGIDVKSTGKNWVLCLPCEKGSQKSLTEQLEGIRTSLQSPIQSECKGARCDQCRIPGRKASAFGDYSFHDASKEARIKMWCSMCRATIREEGIVPRESSMQGTHVSFAEFVSQSHYQ